MSSNRSARHVLLASLCSILGAGCVSTAREGWWADHVEGDTWTDAYRVFHDDRSQWIPVVATAAATPLLIPFDRQNTSESVSDHVFNSNTRYGDELAVGLGLAPLAWGAFDALSAGDSRFLEVSTEAMGITLASTYALKTAFQRERPDHSGHDSFPSGHASFAFAGATLLGRRWSDTHDGSWLGYLLYLPASYVGISRLEGGRHWLSDITFGAAIGIFTSHIVYDAHYGDADSPGLFPRGRTRLHTSFGPELMPEGFGLGWSASF